jgi:hypothetical protein
MNKNKRIVLQLLYIGKADCNILIELRGMLEIGEGD